MNHSERDWWPFGRLLITTSVFALGAHSALGWKFAFHDFLALPLRFFGVFGLYALLSLHLAHLLLVLICLPVFVVIRLNDLFYEVSYWGVSSLIGMKSGRSAALLSLGGEISLFMGSFALLRLIIRVLVALD